MGTQTNTIQILRAKLTFLFLFFHPILHGKCVVVVRLVSSDRGQRVGVQISLNQHVSNRAFDRAFGFLLDPGRASALAVSPRTPGIISVVVMFGRGEGMGSSGAREDGGLVRSASEGRVVGAGRNPIVQLKVHRVGEEVRTRIAEREGMFMPG